MGRTVSSPAANQENAADTTGQIAGMSSADLVRAAVGGDLSAFEMLVQQHWKMAVALALTRIADPAEAEDVAQESFLRAHRHLRNLRDPSRFAGWLSKIVVQQSYSATRRYLRRRKALGETTVPPQTLEALPAHPSNPGLTEHQIQSVQSAVRTLPERFRRLIAMRFVAGLSSVEIAAQLGEQPGTVRTWLHRACRILRRELEPFSEEMHL